MDDTTRLRRRARNPESHLAISELWLARSGVSNSTVAYPSHGRASFNALRMARVAGERLSV